MQTVLAVIVAFVLVPAPREDAKRDEEILRQAKIPTDRAGLQDYLLKGKAVDGLIAQLKYGSPKTRQEATKRLIEIGIPALPGLTGMARSKDDVLAERAEHCRKSILELFDDEVQSALVRVVIRRKPEGMGEFLLRFLPLVNDNDFRKLIIDAFAPMMEREGRVDPVLITALRDPWWQQQMAALDIIANLGPKAAPAVPVLLEVGRPSDRLTDAAKAMGEASGPYLVRALKDQRPRIRAVAAGWLASSEAHNPKAVPALIEATRDEDLWVRQRVLVALGKYPSEARIIAPVLLKIIEDDDPKAKAAGMPWEAAKYLGNLGTAAEFAIPTLEKMGRSTKDKVVRACVVSAIGQIKPKNKKVASYLIELLQDEKENLGIRAEAAHSLGLLEAECATPALIEALKVKDAKDPYWAAEVRSSAAWALLYMGPKAKKAIPALQEALKDEDAKVRRTAQSALERIAN